MREIPILFTGDMVRAVLEGRKTQTRRVLNPQPWSSAKSGHFSPSHPAGNSGTWPAAALFSETLGCAPPWACAQPIKSPYGEPGDRLWVRETHDVNRLGVEELPSGRRRYYAGIVYQADGGRAELDTTEDAYMTLDQKESRGWTPSIHMPRWASRIMLDVTAIRVERLQDISEEDAVSEGARYTDWGLKVPPGRASLDGGRTFHPFKPQPQNGWHIKNVKGPEQCLLNARIAFANYINGLVGGKNWNLKPTNIWNENPWVWVVEFRRVEA